MKLFTCRNCGQVLYFENTRCERCGHALGYRPDTATIEPLEPSAEQWCLFDEPNTLFRFCANAQHDACNWLIPADSDATFCVACRHNRTIPDLTVPENLTRWQKLEVAKRRLFYTLMALKLPLANREDNPESGLAFDFLTSEPIGREVMTGHDQGLITINLKEADDLELEKSRMMFAEPYRTVIGHFRHEIGHYYWQVLVENGGNIESFRALFGDESADYGAALEKYYNDGAPASWQDDFVSAYASAHPHEDFAESWAHYLHIVDTLETARAFGLRVNPEVSDDPSLQTDLAADPKQTRDIDVLIDDWLPLTFALNSISRGLGGADLYPFILSPRAIEKLDYILRLVKDRPTATQPSATMQSNDPVTIQAAE